MFLRLKIAELDGNTNGNTDGNTDGNTGLKRTEKKINGNTILRLNRQADDGNTLGNTYGNTVSTVSYLPAGELNFESSAILMRLVSIRKPRVRN
jgi:hypothetical protein